MNYLPQIAAAFVPGAINAAGQVASAGMGNVTGQAAGAGLNADPALNTLNRAGIQLNPDQQMQLQQHYARQAAQDNFNDQSRSAAFGAGLTNTGANLSTERQMALNAQQNAAQNVANQLGALRDRSRDNAQAITQAMQMGGAGFR